ncbi:hypothetical protein Airi01_076560 [Actinoallomurus iriomotensis]|uniref:Uncharacterized protein n=1 Tax=Actinoallomurus iriomotensis TaxID=478107 RepID=A0A9W6VTR0_9ACTN|nr:hypothetical protein Airi01_076560 [Actinoallomurus iriomotensis]
MTPQARTASLNRLPASPVYGPGPVLLAWRPGPLGFGPAPCVVVGLIASIGPRFAVLSLCFTRHANRGVLRPGEAIG